MYIFQALLRHFERSKASGHSENARQLAFQLAFCYLTGFGVRRDVSTSQKFLALSNSSIEDLQKQLDILQQETVDPRYGSQVGEFEVMWDDGLVQGMNLAQYYRDNPSSANEPILTVEISEHDRSGRAHV